MKVPTLARRPAVLPAAVIVLAAVAAYSGSFGGPFVFDDPSSITANPTIRHLWPLWPVLATPKVSVTVEGRPLLNFSFALNYALGGTRVFGYHLVNLAIHIAAGLALFGVVRRTLVRIGNPQPVLCAFAAALLWTLQPIQTEAVTYVVQRAESLMGLFYLVTVYCFVRGAEFGVDGGPAGSELRKTQSGRQDRSSSGSLPEAANELRYSPAGPPSTPNSSRVKGMWFGLSWMACLFGMGTKEVMVSAPVMVLLYDRTFVAGTFREAWRKRWGYYAALAATWIPLAALVVRGGGDRSGSVGFGVHVGFWDYFATQFEAVGRYLILAVWPHPLVFEYGIFWVRSLAQVLPWACLVVPVVVLTLAGVWRRPRWGFLGVWFFAILAPTSLVPGTSQMIVEHRMYLALAAVVVAVVMAASYLPRRARVPCFGLFFLASAAFGCMTAARNRDYRSEFALWNDTLAKRPDNPLAHSMLGQVLDREGRTGDALGQYAEAVRLDPTFALAQEKMGEMLFKLGRTPEAILRYREALRLYPDFADANDNLGMALAGTGDRTDAEALFRRTIAIDPGYTEAHYNLACVLAQTGRPREAVAEFEATLNIDPKYAAAHFNLGNTLADLGRGPEACAQYAAAVEARPDYPEAEYNWANVLAETGHAAESLPHYAAAVRLKPDFAEAEGNWGAALLNLGRWDEAERHLASALRLKPDLADARLSLERLLAQRSGNSPHS